MAPPELQGRDKFTVQEAFLNTTHGKLTCIGCHGGRNVNDKAEAHRGRVEDPSAENGGVCARCHGETAEKYSTALHYNLNGFVTSLETFSHPGVLNEGGPLSQVFAMNCNNCHATCGQCHVSRPNAMKGGLLSQHQVEKKPPMDKTCYGCHGARNAGEYVGEVTQRADVHYEKLNMDCMSCHKIDNFHGTGKADKEMYQVAELPECTDCHQEVASGKSEVLMHNVHASDSMSCQVCHAQAAQSCSDCHLSFTDETKTAVVSKSHPTVTFKIGLNPQRDDRRPWKYVPVRHVPTVADSFKAAGENLLPDYDKVPNWKMSPTHNIRRFTTQNSDCNSCHGNSEVFLTRKDLIETDSKANEQILVPAVPW